MLAWLTAAAMATASPACVDIPGAKQLWVNATTRWLVVGEFHGTNEMPAAFADLVCQAALDRGKIVVALEYPRTEQAALDAYIRSDGGKAATTALTRGPFWRRSIQDGRSSIGMLAMLERLRMLKRSGSIAEVRGIDPEMVIPTRPGGRDTGMASILRELGTPNGLVMVYVGNVHAMKTKLERPGSAYMPATGQLPPSETVSVWLWSNGGGAWTCQLDGCAARNNLPPRQAKRGVVIAPGEAPFDFVFELGIPTTVSNPAISPEAGTP